ncbi:hypothetical protein P3T76_014100 [Phytophthora citrophthora]|uniref:Uncharacterized protein n=1 Tax=Phytophthora citrophthora TaxID=4793 RepID=A0AAD9LCL7_9STRA|nr:hypothetical protein P3T76_014100 [Phytophthora citrophthora]
METSKPRDEETSSATSSGNSAAMTALEELQQVFTSDPNAERVSLRGHHLTQEEAEQIFIFFDIRDNDLHELPRDFGARLPKLVALNLLNNSFRFRMGALKTLGETLQHCPCLNSLSLSLSAPEEQVLLSMLPRLRILNGTPLPFTRSDNPASPTLKELQQFCTSPLPLNTTEKKLVARDSLKASVSSRGNVMNSVRPTELPTSISDDRDRLV